jgi:acyl-CoA synthetase (AMP-forming)/AMP-acid ligase II
MLHRVVHHADVPKYDLSSLTAVSFGAAPMPPETLRRAREVLPVKENLTNAYGLTETHGVATLNGGKDLLGRGGSIGRPLPILDMQIGDPNGNPLPDGQLGELQIHGPTVTPGYWNRPEATAETVVRGWLRTGDLGTRDAEGFFFIADRAKDMIIRGGENVYCTEIENVLASHPEIDEACVIGVPDPELGERVKAIVFRRPDSQLDAGAVQRHVARAWRVQVLTSWSSPIALPRNRPASAEERFPGTGAVPFQTDDLNSAWTSRTARSHRLVMAWQRHRAPAPAVARAPRSATPTKRPRGTNARNSASVCRRVGVASGADAALRTRTRLRSRRRR